jgi:hypothetical protein
MTAAKWAYGSAAIAAGWNPDSGKKNAGPSRLNDTSVQAFPMQSRKHSLSLFCYRSPGF